MKLLLIILIVIYIYLWYKKATFYKDRKDKKKIISTFEKHEWITEKISRTETHSAKYPFVKIKINDEEFGIFRLTLYGFNIRYFKKREVVPVFWLNNKLVYWHSYENIFMKLFPKYWPF